MEKNLEEEYFKQAKKEVEEKIKSRVGNLRQWINEKQSGVVTNEDLLYWLGLASSEEVKESHEKEKRLREIFNVK